MPIHREEHKENYTTISNEVLRNKQMSIKARGLLTTLLSLPDDWDFSVNGLMQIVAGGRECVSQAVKELEKLGYLKRERITNEKGQFDGYKYLVYEKPFTEKPFTEKPFTENPFTEKPFTEKPFTENPQQLNKDILNKDILSKDIQDIQEQEKKEKKEKNLSGEAGVKKEKFKQLQPTFAEIIDYAASLNIENAQDEAEEFFDYNESIGWMLAPRVPVTDWKALFNGWLSNRETETSF